MSNTHQNSCQFAEQLINYLYGESERHEKIRFETHLKNCASCAVEIADLQTARSSVLEWREADFSNLSAPLIDVSAITGVTNAVASESSSVIGGWRRFFSFNPAFAAAMAVLIVCVGIVFFAVKFSGDREIADNGGEKNTIQPIVSPTAGNSNRAETKIAESKKPTENAAPQVRETVNAPEESERKTVPVKTSVKNSDAPKVEPTNRRAKDAGETNKKTPPAKKQTIPNLNDAEDEADESIRLADLFAELDTK